MAAYLIVDIEVNDVALYKEYRRQVPPMVAAYGGRFLVTGGPSEVLEGNWQPRSTVVVEFSDMAALKAFWLAPEYQPLRALRERAATSSLFAVEGVES